MVAGGIFKILYTARPYSLILGPTKLQYMDTLNKHLTLPSWIITMDINFIWHSLFNEKHGQFTANLSPALK